MASIGHDESLSRRAWAAARAECARRCTIR
jgi:hypothetical protein